MRFYHGTAREDMQLHDSQQTRTQRGVGLSPHLHCARWFGHVVLVVETDCFELQSHTDHPHCHWTDRDSVVALAETCRVVDILVYPTSGKRYWLDTNEYLPDCRPEL